MVRTQIQLTEEQSEFLTQLAVERKASVAALIREAVDGMASKPLKSLRWQRALAVTGKFSSGADDISQRHDDYLADAFR